MSTIRDRIAAQKNEIILVPSRADLLASPRAYNGGYYWTRTWWTPREEAALSVLCHESVTPDAAATSLGRSPRSITWRARDTGLILPPAWRDVIRPANLGPRAQLAYPFMVQPRDEHALLLAVNNWVPHYIPGREDICQEIMLAVLDGRVTIDALAGRKQMGTKKEIRKFIGSFSRGNYEYGGFALSVDAPFKDDWGEDIGLTLGDFLEA